MSAIAVRPAYLPSTMLKLFLNGYLNRIQSSRRLEWIAGSNVEKNNGKGIKNTCREFIGLCRQLNLFTDAVVAIDGSKFKVVNRKENNDIPKKLKSHIDRGQRCHMGKQAQVALDQESLTEIADKGYYGRADDWLGRLDD